MSTGVAPDGASGEKRSAVTVPPTAIPRLITVERIAVPKILRSITFSFHRSPQAQGGYKPGAKEQHAFHPSDCTFFSFIGEAIFSVAVTVVDDTRKDSWA